MGICHLCFALLDERKLNSRATNIALAHIKRKHDMTSATTKSAATVPFGAVTLYNIVSSFDELRLTIRAWNARRVTRNALKRLSDAQMNDIGLTYRDVRRMPLEAGKY